ncbi:MAG: methylmalonyl Co-A mutase-associated GTPase MeaB [Candidatus Aminicenantes bacterium]|nr:methylmalonyl Co-A mutase-associated GTPase MeaB [Candidatus Aminicenantes bacterium]
MKISDMLLRIRQNDPVALAKAISMVENRKKDYAKLLRGIYPLPGRAFKIGITGSPGSGKSSLIDRMISGLKTRGLNIAVLAVDPSSPISGGALLGDRLRMIQHSNDANVFIRSIANRGHLGGLSLSTHEIIDLLQAAGKEIIIIETVGVGQSEVDIVNVADVVLYVLNPGSGDEIQIFKAGIIEIADVFVVNKADLGGSELKISEIKNYFALATKNPPIFATSAKEDQGIAELLAALFKFREEERGRIEEKSAAVKKNYIEKIVADRLRAEIEQNPAIVALWRASADANPFELAEAIYRIIQTGGSHDKKN